MPARFIAVHHDRSVDFWVNHLFKEFNNRIPIRQFRESLEERFKHRPYIIVSEGSRELQKLRELGEPLHRLENGIVHQYQDSPYDRLNDILVEMAQPRKYRWPVPEQLVDLNPIDYADFPKFEPYLNHTVCKN